MTFVPLLLLLLARPGLAQELAVIGPGDTVNLTVADQPALTKGFVVSPNGTITLDLVGEIPAAGLVANQLEADLRRRLAAFLVNPRVQVQVAAAQRVFVFGEVPSPGPVGLTANMTLLEALTRVGYKGASEVVVVRPRFQGPAPIDAIDAQVVRVNLRELEKDIEAGRLERNLLLRDSDTIYVPSDDPNRIYVNGAVMKPGPYSVPEGTTVIQALSLAGGVTEDAAVGRLQVTRIVKGDLQSLKVSPDDAVEPGDSVIVPTKIPLPALDMGLPPADPANLPGRIRLGRMLSVRPSAAIKRIGVDNNVLNNGESSSDFTIAAGPRLETTLGVERLKVEAEADLDFVYFRQFASERSINRTAMATLTIAPVNRFRLTALGTTVDTRERLDSTIDERLRRFEQTFEVAVEFQPLKRLEIKLSGRDFDRTFADPSDGVERVAPGIIADLGKLAVYRLNLTERVQSAMGMVRFRITPLTHLFTSGSSAKFEFPQFPDKDADVTEFYIGGDFQPSALLSGEARVGYLRYLGRDPKAPDLEGVVGSANLHWQAHERTRLGFVAERTTGNSFQSDFSAALHDRAGASIQQALTRRFDVLLETYHEKFRFARYGPVGGGPRPEDGIETSVRYVTELGVRMQAIRVGVNLTYVQRLSTIHTTRDYNALRVMMNVSYGAFQGRRNE